MAGEKRRLKPAKPTTASERSPFGPKLPWKWIVVGVSVVTLLAGIFWIRRVRQIETLRSDILEVREEAVAPAAERIERFRSRLERWIAQAAKEDPQEAWVDARLQFSGLHDAQGVYLRIPHDAADDPEQIAEAAREMGEDKIASCMGLTPSSLRGLYEHSEFLSPEVTEEVRSTDSLMRLRVLDEQLARNVKRTLPILLHMLQSDYFLLVLEHGENRRDAPVDVFLWDLRENRQLLRAHVEAEGILLPVRVQLGDAPRAPGKPPLRSGGANDCSIASQVKALAGEPPLSLGAKATDALDGSEETSKQSPKGDAGAAAPDAGP